MSEKFLTQKLKYPIFGFLLQFNFEQDFGVIRFWVFSETKVTPVVTPPQKLLIYTVNSKLIFEFNGAARKFCLACFKDSKKPPHKDPPEN